MKTHILRLGSVVANGVGGPEAGAIDLIYTCLLQHYEQDIYSHIHINQIGDDLNELIGKEGNNVYINIRYPVHQGFESKSVEDKNRIRLDVVHQGLLRIAEHYGKIDIIKLEAIKSKILENNFCFDFIYRTHVNKKRSSLIGKIVVSPKIDRFNFYAVIEESGNQICKLLIYSGKTTHYFEDFFFYGKWKNENEFVISGKRKEVEIHVSVDKCSCEFKNLTHYEKPPYFEMMRADISEADKEKAYRDWVHSMPPGIAAIVTQEPN